MLFRYLLSVRVCCPIIQGICCLNLTDINKLLHEINTLKLTFVIIKSVLVLICVRFLLIVLLQFLRVFKLLVQGYCGP